MKRLMVLWLFGVGLLATPVLAADERAAAFHNLSAAPPANVIPLPTGKTVRPVRLAKVVVHLQDGEPWALVYYGFRILDREAPPPDRLVAWEAGRVDGRLDAFGQAFDGELSKAGFIPEAQDTLFGDAGSSDLQVGVVIDDMKARFCMNCPNVMERDGVTAVGVMKAHWEVYSAVRGKVIAKVDTEGGVTWREKNGDSVMPVVLAAFRDNVRRLLAAEDFRRAVTEDAPPPDGAPPLLGPITLQGASRATSIDAAQSAVALVFGGDAMGSAFLVSSDGYMITNRHVVRDSPVLRVRWSDKSETTARVIRSDVRRDVALLKVDDLRGRAPLSVRRESPLVGEAVFAIGTPLEKDFQNTVTKGVVSANRNLDGQSFIQSDVAVDHGNSGGPLLDDAGRVLGITQWGYAPDGVSHNLNFFIPIGDALRVLAVEVQDAPRSAPPRSAAKTPVGKKS